MIDLHGLWKMHVCLWTLSRQCGCCHAKFQTLFWDIGQVNYFFTLNSCQLLHLECVNDLAERFLLIMLFCNLLMMPIQPPFWLLKNFTVLQFCSFAKATFLEVYPKFTMPSGQSRSYDKFVVIWINEFEIEGWATLQGQTHGKSVVLLQTCAMIKFLTLCSQFGMISNQSKKLCQNCSSLLRCVLELIRGKNTCEITVAVFAVPIFYQTFQNMSIHCTFFDVKMTARVNDKNLFSMSAPGWTTNIFSPRRDQPK